MNTLEYYNSIKDKHPFTHISLHSILKRKETRCREYLDVRYRKYLDMMDIFYLYKETDTHFLFLVFLEDNGEIECISGYIPDMRDFIILTRDKSNTSLIEYFFHLFDQAQYPVYPGYIPESVSEITKEFTQHYVNRK